MKKFLMILASLIAGTILSACADLLNLTIPGDGYGITKNIAYGENPRQKLDVYSPEQKADGAPVIVFFYGGRWETGSKDDYLFVGQALASKGFTVVIADYKLFPKVRFPAFIEDGALAIKWAHDHIRDYGGNPDNLFVAGHSSGAYNAIMLVTNPAYLKKVGGSEAWLRGGIGLAGPYDFLPFTDQDIKDIFSTAPGAQTQPITFAHADMPPLFLAAGKDDTTVKPKNSINLAKKAQSLGDVAELHIYPDVKHIGIILAMARGFRGKAPVLDDVTAFVDKYNVKNDN